MLLLRNILYIKTIVDRVAIKIWSRAVFFSLSVKAVPTVVIFVKHFGSYYDEPSIEGFFSMKILFFFYLFFALTP